MTKHFQTGARPFETKADAPPDPATAVDRIMRGFEEYKSTNDARLKELETKGSADVLHAEKLTRIDKMLDGYEAMSQKVATADEVKKQQAEIQTRFDALETMLRRKGTGDPTEVKNRGGDFIRAAHGAFQRGELNLAEADRKLLTDIAAEYKALSVGTDTAGGYLAPVEFVREIIKGVTEMSAPRPLVRVRQTSGKSVEIPKRTGQFAAQRVIEGGAKTETTGLSWGIEELNAPEMFALVDVTNQMLEDSAFDVQSEITMEATDQFAKAEGQEWVSGTGVGQLEGILVNGSIGSTGTGSAAITGAGLISLKYAVKSEYAKNGTFVLNRTSIGAVRKLVDGNGVYIWQPGLALGRPNTIDGDPYVEMPDMPNEGAAAYPVAYGDFKRGYTMLDRITLEMLRDQFTQAGAGKVRFIWRKRVGGKVVLAEAIRKLVCS